MNKKTFVSILLFGKQYPITFALFLIGGISTLFGFYKVYPFINVTPIGHVPGEGCVYVGLIMLYIGMMRKGFND